LQGVTEQVAETGPSTVEYTPRFITIGSGIPKLLGVGEFIERE
jgi:hypothetical protein